MEGRLIDENVGNQFGDRGAERVFVIVDGTDAALTIVHQGKQLADAYQVPWEAIFAETSAENDAGDLTKAGEALGLAARLGATVYRLPGATVADTVAEHIKTCGKPHIVLNLTSRPFLQRVSRPSIQQELARRDARIVFHGIATANAASAILFPRTSAPLRHYLLAAAGALLTLAFVLFLKLVTGTSYLSVLFLFPVITAAARLGLRPALLAALLSSIGFNFLFLNPLRSFDPWVAQTWLMLAVLAAVAVHTSWLTGTLRGRLALSDRSAQESAALAAFAQKLTRVADWSSTGKTVCFEVRKMLDVRTLLVREIDGELHLVSSEPAGATLDPLDKTALDWAWRHGEPTGSGTSVIQESGWQFQPLVTSLGVLAVLGLAREDGRTPVPVERELLLGTIVAQASLAHERLRLEDRAREALV